MELKLRCRTEGTAQCDCSNRTFMELKYLRWLPREKQVASSNRTFMELK